jgi:outer membrane receptor protein involved in Fe transport
MTLYRHRTRLRALGVFSIFLITLLPVPCLAQVETPSESTASTDGEPGDDAEDRAGDEGTDGEAADELSPSSNVEEIVIQGARSEGLKNEPISVTQFGSSEIKSLRIQDVADVSDYTPNLEINTSFAASNPTLFIRGVGLKDYNSNSAGAVGIWHDDIQMNSPSAQLFSLYDIESIEVLRGPVGGLGGRNSTAGAIRMHSFKPNGELTSLGSFTYGNLNLLEFEGALGFPILPDTFGGTLSARVSATLGFRDGYTDNKCSNWDPSAFGFLTPTEDATRELYDSMDPFDRGSGFANNSRYVYRNLEAVEQYNAAPGTARINLVDSVPEDGLPPGSKVGLQGPSVLQIPSDGVCVLDAAGSLTTKRLANNRKPEGTWTAARNAKPLSDFQGLQDTYNDVEYYATRFQMRWEPTDRWDVLGNFHWGANRGDSFHLQQVGVEASIVDPDAGVISEPLGFFQGFNAKGWSELTASQIIPFELPETRNGLFGTRANEGSKPLSERAPGFATDDHRSGFYSSDGKELLDLWGTSATVTYEPDWGQIVSITGYEFNSRDIQDEGDANPGTELEAIYEDEARQITQDLRLEFLGDRYALTFGGFYIHEEVSSRNLFLSSIRFNTDQLYEQSLNAWNVGADLHYDFLEEGARSWLYQISLDGGFRYNWEHKDFSLESTTRSTVNQVERPAIEKGTVDGLWQAPTGEVTLSILPLENLRIYGKYTHGFKAGHFNAGLTIEPKPGGNVGEEVAKQSLEPVEPEFTDAAEIGLKSTWFDDRLDISGALFRYWYTDLQVFDIVNEAGALPTQQLLNADADVLGAELEAILRPIEGLMLQGALGWLDASFGEFLVEKVVVPPRGGPGGGGQRGQTSTFNYEGNRLIAAPEWSVTGYAEYEIPLFGWGSLVPIFDFWYKSQVYLDPQQEELISQEPVWILNARLAYRVPIGNFEVEVAGWVKNMLDTEYRIDAFDESRQFNHILEVWSEPRTYGLTISYAY